jgi:hypothetical protein
LNGAAETEPEKKEAAPQLEKPDAPEVKPPEEPKPPEKPAAPEPPAKPEATEPPAQPQAPEQPAEQAQPESADEKPSGLIGHITVIDKLKARISATEEEVTGLKNTLSDRKELLRKLKRELADEIDIIKTELGLEAAPPKKAHDQFFHFADGTIASNGKELLAHMLKIPDDVFAHHCNAERNDFYYWVRDVLQDKELASRVKKIHTRRDVLNILS